MYTYWIPHIPSEHWGRARAPCTRGSLWSPDAVDLSSAAADARRVGRKCENSSWNHAETLEATKKSDLKQENVKVMIEIKWYEQKLLNKWTIFVISFGRSQLCPHEASGKLHYLRTQ